MKNTIKKQSLKQSLLVASIALATTQVQAYEPRIIGGSVANANGYSWIVSLQSGGQHFCGASLINKDWVMTAAHCVEQESAGSVNVVVGEYNLSQTDKGEQKSGVSNIVIHPKRSSGEDHDIALLKLATPINAGVVTRATPAVMTGIKTGSLLTVMGWGNMSTSGQQFPDKLNEVQVPLVSHEQCSKNYGAGSITENMVCAGYTQGGKDSCQGDSGGPLLYQMDGQWHQVGIVSFGEGCALPNYPGVYAKVSQYDDWVKQVMAGTGQPSTTNPTTPTEPETNPDTETDTDISNETDISGAGMFNLPDEVDLVAFDGKPEENIILLENITNQAIEISDITTNHPAFSVDKQACVTSLASDAICELTITYQPQSSDVAEDGVLTIDTAGGESVTVKLLGNNLDASALDDEAGWDWYMDQPYWTEDEFGFSANNATMNDDQTAMLEVMVQGPGTFEFNFDAEGDTHANSCTYSVDGKAVRTVRAGQQTKSHHTTQLSAGQHRITWVYKKKEHTGGTFKITDVKLNKNADIQAKPQISTDTTNAATQATPQASATNNSSGGGSHSVWFLSGLVMLLAGLRRFRFGRK